MLSTLQINDDVANAYLFDGSGGARTVNGEEIADWTPPDGNLWIHLNFSNHENVQWLMESSDLDPLVVEALLAEETRPRATVIADGLLISLRGVNLNPGADPEDMVSLRLWIDATRIISTGKRDLLSVSDLVEQLESKQGPCGPADFLAELTDRLVWHMSDTVDQFEDQVAELEEQVLTTNGGALRNDLASLRRQAIAIRRYLAPEREAMNRLIGAKVSWLDEGNRLRLRDVSDRLIRHIEDIDAVRERAAVTQEEMQSRLAEQMNSRMYVLSVVAAVFLPLGFLTGLLGINVGGIPGTDSPDAFYEFIGMLTVVVVLQVLLFRWKKWM